MALSKIINVELRENYAKVRDDLLSEIDTGGVFYINLNKEVFFKVDKGIFLQGLHGHDSKGNKYHYCGEIQASTHLYDKNMFHIDSVIEDLRDNARSLAQ